MELLGKFRKVFAVLVALAALAGFCAPSYADSFRLRIEDVGAGVGAVLTDNGLGDLNPLVGAMTFSGSVGLFIVNVTTGVSKPIIGGVSNLSELDLNSVNVNIDGPGTLRITLEDTDYTAGADGPLFVHAGVGGTLTAPAGSSITFNTWVNPGDLVPALGPDVFPVAPLGAIGGTPGGSVAGFGAGVTFGPGAYAASNFAIFTKSGDYSLFSQSTIAFTGAGTSSFDLNTQVEVIPEPSSLLLFGAGLTWLGLWSHRRSKQTKR